MLCAIISPLAQCFLVLELQLERFRNQGGGFYNVTTEMVTTLMKCFPAGIFMRTLFKNQLPYQCAVANESCSKEVLEILQFAFPHAVTSRATFDEVVISLKECDWPKVLELVKACPESVKEMTPVLFFIYLYRRSIIDPNLVLYLIQYL